MSDKLHNTSDTALDDNLKKLVLEKFAGNKPNLTISQRANTIATRGHNFRRGEVVQMQNYPETRFLQIVTDAKTLELMAAGVSVTYPIEFSIGGLILFMHDDELYSAVFEVDYDVAAKLVSAADSVIVPVGSDAITGRMLII